MADVCAEYVHDNANCYYCEYCAKGSDLIPRALTKWCKKSFSEAVVSLERDFMLQ